MLSGNLQILYSLCSLLASVAMQHQLFHIEIVKY